LRREHPIKALAIIFVLIFGGAWWCWDAFTTGKAQMFVNERANEKWAPGAENFLAELYELTGRYPEAMQCYQKIIEVTPDDPLAEKAMYRVGVCLTELHRFNESIHAFDDFLAKYPKSGFAQLAWRRRAAVVNR
jgi:TolA-binding protein